MQANNIDGLKSYKDHLKAQIRSELRNIKQCNYHSYECTQQAMNNYDYCEQHILSDKSAPFRTCSYIYGSGKQCYASAYSKGNKKDLPYCNDHALKTHLLKAKQGASMQPPRNAETLLSSLSHYVKRTENCSKGIMSPDTTGTSMDPFVEIDACSINASCSDVLNLCSDSDSDIEVTTLSNVWQDAHADSSGDESIDSENEDPLKHAEILTAEEVARITKDKLSRLHSLYINQYAHLGHMLREKRRRYLYDLKKEKETYCSISNQSRERPNDQRIYKKLKAFNQYHKKFGKDAILRKQLNEKRAKITEGILSKPSSHYIKCSFSEGGVKCSERAMPISRHCRKHILMDPYQVLFRPCGKKRGDIECETPVEAIYDDQTCVLHRDIPPLRIYAHLRKDSESDVDDQLLENKNVKTELLNLNSPNNSLDETMKEEPLSTDEDVLITEPHTNETYKTIKETTCASDEADQSIQQPPEEDKVKRNGPSQLEVPLNDELEDFKKVDEMDTNDV